MTEKRKKLGKEERSSVEDVDGDDIPNTVPFLLCTPSIPFHPSSGQEANPAPSYLSLDVVLPILCKVPVLLCMAGQPGLQLKERADIGSGRLVILHSAGGG